VLGLAVDLQGRTVISRPATQAQATAQPFDRLPAGVTDAQSLVPVEDLCRVAVVAATGQVDNADYEILGRGAGHVLPDAGLSQQRQNVAQHVTSGMVRHGRHLLCTIDCLGRDTRGAIAAAQHATSLLAASYDTSLTHLCDSQCHRLTCDIRCVTAWGGHADNRY
jgi:hypothetical protein